MRASSQGPTHLRTNVKDKQPNVEWLKLLSNNEWIQYPTSSLKTNMLRTFLLKTPVLRY